MALWKLKICHFMIIVLCSYKIISTSKKNKKPDDGMICPDEYVWNQMQNKCTSCMDGFIGRNCKVQCPPPSYGKKCQLECKCQPTDCHHAFGCRRSESGCVKGKQENFCEKSCPYPSYGQGCQLLCKCKSQFYDPAHGCLNGTTQKRVSKLAEERDGNWTPTSMKSQGTDFTRAADLYFSGKFSVDRPESYSAT
ncbi:uncharacterized protein LOC111104459 [Crassostrea virginica]